MAFRAMPVVQPLGLITTPNRWGQYPEGALSICENLLFREPGKMRAIKAWQPPNVMVPGGGFGYAITEGAQNRFFAWAYHPINFATAYWIDILAGTEAAAGLYDTLSTLTGIISFDTIVSHVAVDRMFSNSLAGLLVGDSLDPTTAAERSMRWGGMCQPWISTYNTGSTVTADGAIKPQSIVNYVAILRRKFSDGYEIVSVPSSPQQVENGHATDYLNPIIYIKFGTGSAGGNTRVGCRAGDVLELYRTQGTALVAGADAGSTYYLARTYVLTSSDEFDGETALIDTARWSEIGLDLGGLREKELYTNPFLGGKLARAKRQPPVAQMMCEFKGYVFYGHVTDRPRWAVSFPVQLGLLSNASSRAGGIGQRLVSGSSAIGSPTITGISAADMVGLVVGQELASSAFAAGARIITVGATSITMHVNATAVQTVHSVLDMVEIDGQRVRIASARDFLDKLHDTTFTSQRFYEITFDQPIRDQMLGVSMVLEPARFIQGFVTVRGTNGQNYDPPIPQMSQAVARFDPVTRKNGLRWSEFQQPESVPTTHETDVGFGEIYQGVPTRDALWIWCSDGLRRLSGEAGVWRVDDVDLTIELAGPRAVTTYQDIMYAWTERGFVAIDSKGFVANLSQDVISTDYPGRRFNDLFIPNVFAREDTGEIFIVLYNRSIEVHCICYQSRFRVWSEIPFFSTIGAAVNIRKRLSNAPQGLMILHQVGGVNGDACWSVWDDTSPGTSVTVQAVYQPVSDGDPFLTKEWVDGLAVFDAGTANCNPTFTWGGASFGQTITLVSLPQYNEVRLNLGVPREAPAYSPFVTPGFFDTVSPGQQLGFCGFSLRYSRVSSQEPRR